MIVIIVAGIGLIICLLVKYTQPKPKPYVTHDGHEMREGEVMWRVSNEQGKWIGKDPGRVVFKSITGYNTDLVGEKRQGLGAYTYKAVFNGRPSFPPMQIHFFDKQKAINYLNSK